MTPDKAEALPKHLRAIATIEAFQIYFIRPRSAIVENLLKIGVSYERLVRREADLCGEMSKRLLQNLTIAHILKLTTLLLISVSINAVSLTTGIYRPNKFVLLIIFLFSPLLNRLVGA